MKNEMDEAVKSLFTAIFMILATVALFVFSLWVGMVLFNWHIAPYLHLAPVGIWHILGIFCAVSLFKSKPVSLAAQKIIDQNYEGIPGRIGVMAGYFIIDCIILFLGWIAK